MLKVLGDGALGRSVKSAIVFNLFGVLVCILVALAIILFGDESWAYKSAPFTAVLYFLFCLWLNRRLK